MYRVLARARIVVNRHGPVAKGYANNMRLFEATGTGAMLVTEAAPNLSEYFEVGREVVTYDGPDDLMDKLSHYLEHDDERRAIAAAGQARTLRDHTYARGDCAARPHPRGTSAVSSRREFCTLFDSNYLVKAAGDVPLAASAHCPDFHLTAFCFDEEAEELLAELGLRAPDRSCRLRDLEAPRPALLAAKATASPVEYCWTATPALCRYLLETRPELGEITYLDADLLFFSDPEPLFEEMGDASVLITPHRFAPEYADQEENGIYNVQFMTFRRDERGLQGAALVARALHRVVLLPPRGRQARRPEVPRRLARALRGRPRPRAHGRRAGAVERLAVPARSATASGSGRRRAAGLLPLPPGARAPRRPPRLAAPRLPRSALGIRRLIYRPVPAAARGRPRRDPRRRARLRSRARGRPAAGRADRRRSRSPRRERRRRWPALAHVRYPTRTLGRARGSRPDERRSRSSTCGGRAAIRAELDAAIGRVLDSGWYVLGEEGRAFEEEFAAAIWAAGHAVGVASGTDAIELALRALGDRAGRRGGDPGQHLRADRRGDRARRRDTGALRCRARAPPTMDPGRWRERSARATRAVVPVHLYGQCADIDAIASSEPRVSRSSRTAPRPTARRCAAGPPGTIGDRGRLQLLPDEEPRRPRRRRRGRTGDEDIAARASPAAATTARPTATGM